MGPRTVMLHRQTHPHFWTLDCFQGQVFRVILTSIYYLLMLFVTENTYCSSDEFDVLFAKDLVLSSTRHLMTQTLDCILKR